MPFPPRGLWSGRPGDGRSLFRGKCRSETLAVQAGSPFRASAKHSEPCQGFIQQQITNFSGTAGAGRSKHPRVGSAPPRKRPSRAQTVLSRRSLLGSFLAGRPAGPQGRRGLARRLANSHASLTGRRGGALGRSTRGGSRPFGSGARIKHAAENRASYNLLRGRIVLPCWERLAAVAGNYQAAQQELAPGWGTRAG